LTFRRTTVTLTCSPGLTVGYYAIQTAERDDRNNTYANALLQPVLHLFHPDFIRLDHLREFMRMVILPFHLNPWCQRPWPENKEKGGEHCMCQNMSLCSLAQQQTRRLYHCRCSLLESVLGTLECTALESETKIKHRQHGGHLLEQRLLIVLFSIEMFL